MAEIQLRDKQIAALARKQQVMGALEQELKKEQNAAQELVELIADANGVELTEGTKLDLQNGVLVIPDSKSEEEDRVEEEDSSVEPSASEEASA